MLKNYKPPLQKMGGLKWRNTLFSLILTIVNLLPTTAQDNDYWANAPTGKTKIFSISFIDSENGLAKSADGDVLATTDAGKSWAEKEGFTPVNGESTSQILWQADIYCSIMRTTDGGETWFPYDEGKQQHFCGVYLKDENTGYKVASDFLNKVTHEIIAYSEDNNLDSLIDHPQKCTEYYRNAEEGWSLGWCIKNYNK